MAFAAVVQCQLKCIIKDILVQTKFELLVGVCGSGVKGGVNLKKVGGLNIIIASLFEKLGEERLLRFLTP